MNTAGIVFLSLGILFLVIPAIISLIKHDAEYMIIAIPSILCFMFFLAVNYPDPAKEDVKDGKAIYVKEANVGLDANGDTLYNYSTYRLEWLPEWKYGRKQKKIMRTPITLQEFLFTLNQDEDMRILLIDYKEDNVINSFWESDYIEYKDEHKNWFVQDFILITGGLEITIVESEAELD